MKEYISQNIHSFSAAGIGAVTSAFFTNAAYSIFIGVITGVLVWILTKILSHAIQKLITTHNNRKY